MGFRDRVRTMGFGLPDMGAIRDQMDQKFQELLDELRAIRGVLDAILAETRTQRGAAP
jgi:hypothetical protein